MRAGAVLLVVLFHSWPELVPGGYVGVDVFFVISGYLITRQLLDEIARTGTVAPLAFWVRRARRLLPASLLVLVASALLCRALVPQGSWRQCFREIAASTLYVQNWALAADSVDYFAATHVASPVQHFWTLSVEEQFYLGLPLLSLLTLALARLLPSLRPRQLIAAALASVWVASFVYSVALTLDEPTVAYFSTFTRAWEFGTGALLSLWERPRPRRGLALAGWAGILASAVAFDGGTHLPGALALAPVLASVAVIAGGDRTGDARRARCRGPIEWLGDCSYSIYLWHWPLLVLAPFALGHPLGHAARLAVNALALAIAGASARWVEDPLRHPRPGEGPWRRRGILLGCSATMLGIVLFAQRGRAQIDALERASAQLAERLRVEDPPCLGARSRGAPCVNPSLEGLLVPNPAIVASDFVDRPDCREGRGDSLRVCSLGPSAGYRRRVAAIGDSHIATLIPAFEAVAEALGWRIDVAARNACHWTSSVQHGMSEGNSAGCARWKQRLNAWLMAEPPYDAIIVSHRVGEFLPEAAPGETLEATIVRGLLESWRTQVERGARIIAIRDNPVPKDDTVACVARQLLSANAFCSLDRARALSTFDGHVAATRALPGSSLVDLSDVYCDATRCPVVIGNVVVYRDDNHITATFARTLAPILTERLRRILN